MKRITLLFALVVCFSVRGQWVSDTATNTLVANSVSDDAKSIGTSDGKTFIVFWKTVAEPINYELRLQLLDAAGNRQFGDDGMLVSNSIPMSTFTYVWKLNIDKNDNLYISVTGSGTGNPGYVFKIDPSGNQAWPTGLSLGSGLVPTVLPLDNGEVVVAYWPGSGKAKMQKFTADGNPIWAAPADITGASTTSATIPADLYEMADHDIAVVFHQKFLFGVSSNLYFQRYGGTTGIQQWEVPTQLSDKGTAYNAFYSGTQDGDVIYYGYSGATGMRYDGFVQRINADGTLPWGINGMDFDTNATRYEMDVKIAFAPGSESVWAISRYTPSTQDLSGEYVQKFDKTTGARQLGDNAKEVFAVDNHYRNHTADLFLQDDAPLFLIKSGLETGASPINLSAVLLDSNGDFAWGSEILPVATFAAAKGRISLNRPVNNQGVVVFTEEKTSGENKIYAQNFATAVLATESFHLQDDAVKLFPNPTSAQITIAGKSQISSISIFNAAGQKVYENAFANLMQADVDTTSWSNGIYMVKVSTADGKTSAHKLVRN